MMNYFEIRDDVGAVGRWWLRSPRDADGAAVDPEVFSSSQVLDMRVPLTIAVRYDGLPLDFTFADFGMPVVNPRTLSLLEQIASGAFQALPSHIEGVPGDYAIINFLHLQECVDETRSEFLKWNADDHRPDLTGQYRQITELWIDPLRAGGSEIFRLKNFEVVLIASELIRDAFEECHIRGVFFRPVT